MRKLEEIMQNVAEKVPLVHFITNYVTANDCANMCLACNGSPVMADDIEEVEGIVTICFTQCELARKYLMITLSIGVVISKKVNAWIIISAYRTSSV